MSSYQASINNSLFQIEMHEPVTNDWIVVQKLKKAKNLKLSLKSSERNGPMRNFGP